MTDPDAFGQPRFGRVVEFEPQRGLGTLKETSAKVSDGRSYSFHCTAIADGLRAIETGTDVVFMLTPGLGGVIEAAAVTPLGSPAHPQPAPDSPAAPQP
jgi:cold shock CspA family protein